MDRNKKIELLYAVASGEKTVADLKSEVMPDIIFSRLTNAELRLLHELLSTDEELSGEGWNCFCYYSRISQGRPMSAKEIRGYPHTSDKGYKAEGATEVVKAWCKKLNIQIRVNNELQAT